MLLVAGVCCSFSAPPAAQQIFRHTLLAARTNAHPQKTVLISG
jgi:hypothetical protein